MFLIIATFSLVISLIKLLAGFKIWELIMSLILLSYSVFSAWVKYFLSISTPCATLSVDKFKLEISTSGVKLI